MTTLEPKRLEACPFCGSNEAINLRDRIAHPNTLTVGEPYSFGCDICGAEGGTSSTIEFARDNWNRRATRPASEAGVGDVALAEIAEKGRRGDASTMFGFYSIMPDLHTGRNYGTFCVWREPGNSEYTHHASSPDEAKAAAQADYEARIRSALAAPSPSASGGGE